MERKKWVLDPVHSEIQFRVRHMMISNVTGKFTKFEGTVETEGDDMTTAKVHFTADVDSIDTSNAQRDTHLKSADFFEADRHGKITFEGTRMEKFGSEKYTLYGNLTMRGMTKPIELDVHYGGMLKDPWGNMRSGFTVEGQINRKDFGLNWGALTETGGLVAGNEVRIMANVEFVRSDEKELKAAA